MRGTMPSGLVSGLESTTKCPPTSSMPCATTSTWRSRRGPREHVLVHTHTCACAHTHGRTCIPTWYMPCTCPCMSCTCVYTCVQCVHVKAHMRAHVRVRVCVLACACVSMCVCVCTYVYSWCVRIGCQGKAREVCFGEHLVQHR